jgi:hypothetical protein
LTTLIVFNNSLENDTDEDGCIPERTLLAVCILVNANGSWPPLADDFSGCDDAESGPP